ncbi:ecdysteroid 22-kinase family protein [Parvicella tangerina]|uniref:CHK kinase-like domain-containing protein n=1 Tax=Parvicella tangerina TaxID=2829795 RepID=A0A916NGQ5_9FLAO|nr:ecdysteroid 22-kinase family protein [Parvicella tangerina]CAG5081044.1 hypothetical protein CRYO30217_01522 [Parvicella tangerina]
MEEFLRYILQVTGAIDVTQEEEIQQLWSGYGTLYRLHLSGTDFPFAILKWIEPPMVSSHPRGWNTSFGNQRKLKSYQVEANWYKNYNKFCSHDLKYPKLYGFLEKKQLTLLIMEDLTCEGYQTKSEELSEVEVKNTLRWLAKFHAQFMGVQPDGLWEVGTYWHLDTRPEELEKMENEILKENASFFDRKLNECTYQTIIHGDAKQANFAYKDDQVAAFDFQYVGGGCGMKDVIYFLSSCLSEDQIKSLEGELLGIYFSELKKHLEGKYEKKHTEIEQEWRSLYAIAWADFARFLNGWSPGHWKMNDYVGRQVQKVIG